MAWLVGIDEAGYGPHLGPLVVGSAALAFEGDAAPEADLWGALRHHVRRKVNGSTRRVVICDSKDAFTATTGRDAALAVLERTVLAFLGATGPRPRTMAELLAVVGVAPDVGPAALPAPWQVPDDLRLPLAATPADVMSGTDLLGKALGRIQAKPVRLLANAAPAARLNRLMAAGRNKAAALFALTAETLASVRRAAAGEPVHVTMDQHGGRRYYHDLLAGIFPMEQVETVEETPQGSRYLVLPADPDAGPLHLLVRPRCETCSLVTALASMAAKYLRELHMAQLNAYFATRVPDLKPTAGYGPDALRFVRDLAAAGALGGLDPSEMVRAR